MSPYPCTDRYNWYNGGYAFNTSIMYDPGFMFQPYSWYMDDSSTTAYQIVIWALDQHNQPCLVRVSQFCHYVHVRVPDIMTSNEVTAVINYIKSIPDFGPLYDPQLVTGKPLYYYGGSRRFIRVTLHSHASRYRLVSNFRTGDSRLFKVPGTYFAHEYEFCDITVDPIIKYLGYDINNESLTKRHCHWYTIRNTYEVTVSVHMPIDTTMKQSLLSLTRLPLYHASCPSVTRTVTSLSSQSMISIAGSTKTLTGLDAVLIVEADSRDHAVQMVHELFAGSETLWDMKSCTHRSGSTVTTGNATCKVHEYTISANDLLHIPGVTKISKPRILSFDIETYSSGAYQRPGLMPDKMNPSDIIFSISYSIYDAANNTTHEGLFAVIPPDMQDDMQQAIDASQGLSKYQVYMCDDETSMLEQFFDLIVESSPTIIIGFNSLVYDWPQIIARWESPYCAGERIPNISLLFNHKTRNVAKSWSSEQGMSVSATYPSMPGRIHLDLRDIIKSEMRLPNYSLEVTAQIVLGRGKEDVTYTEMFIRYHKLIHRIGDHQQNIADMVQVLVYSAVDASLVTQIFNRRNCWINLIVACNVMYVVPEDRYLRGTQHSNFNLISAQAIASGFMINTYSGVPQSYKGATVIDPVPGFYKNIVCADFASLYPSIIRAYNLCWTTLVKPDDVASRDHAMRFDVDNPNGGINVYHFVRPHHHEGILPKHVGSLVNSRSAVRKKLAAHSAFTKRVKASKGLWLRVVGETMFDSEIITEHETGAVLITDEVINDFDNESTRLDAMQLNLKICANSAYGMMGAQNGGKLCLVAGADTTTYMGRWWIQKVNNELITNHGAKIVYGDTDSTMFDINITDPKECDARASVIINELNAMFPPPMKLEYEKSMGIMICLKKKRYLAYLLKKGELDKKNPLIKGVLSARRDNCAWQRKFYRSVADMCLERKSFKEVVMFIADECDKIRAGKIEVQELIITTGISDSYKKESDPRAIMKKRMLTDHGIELSQGMRVEYVLTTRDVHDSDGKRIGGNNDDVIATGKMKKGEMMLLASTYNDILAAGGAIKLNYDEYIRIVMKQIDDLVSIAYNYIKTNLPHHSLKFVGHYYHVTTPIGMMYRAIKNYHDPCVFHHIGTHESERSESTVNLRLTTEHVMTSNKRDFINRYNYESGLSVTHLSSLQDHRQDTHVPVSAVIGNTVQPVLF